MVNRTTMLVLGVAAAATVATTMIPSSAEAGWRGRRGWAVGAGVLGGLAAGAIIAGATRPAYGYYARPVYAAPAYAGPAFHDGPVCYWKRQTRETWNGDIVVRRVRFCE